MTEPLCCWRDGQKVCQTSAVTFGLVSLLASALASPSSSVCVEPRDESEQLGTGNAGTAQRVLLATSGCDTRSAGAVFVLVGSLHVLKLGCSMYGRIEGGNPGPFGWKCRPTGINVWNQLVLPPLMVTPVGKAGG